jgi:ParB family chromosome partitioning protein
MQPRRDLGDLTELANSIREKGIILPVAVEGPMSDGFYWLLDGERRWRAAILAGLEIIPAAVRAPNGNDDRERLTLALIANMQRKNMDPIELSKAFRELIKLGYSAEEIARQMGVSIQMISLRLRLLDLEPEVQELYAEGRLPLDLGSVRGIESLPEEMRVRVARNLAYRGATGRTIKLVCTRLANGKLHERRPGRKPGRYAQGMRWDALQQAEVKLPAWIETAAMKTCKACVLYEEASPQVCRECPAVDLLKRLVVEEQ